MSKYNILECTLRDGGYITNWFFEDLAIKNMIQGLIDAGLDIVEVGYLNNKEYESNHTIFDSINRISKFLPENRHKSMIVAMADVQQFFPEDLVPYDGTSVDGIRVVFYKHQIEEALTFAKAVKENGYYLFMQPMVTIDYTVNEYAELMQEITELEPYAVSIVDSFGYMTKDDFRKYFKILDNILLPDAFVGFHSHNNMNLALITAQDVLEYETSRKLIIDASLCGMGRGAGNLQTELILNYYNNIFGEKYKLNIILDLISDYIMPVAREKKWGYSPYFYLTALYHCHPNYASYLLENHDVSVAEFKKFIASIPEDMKTKCKKPYVEQHWNNNFNII